MAFTKTYATDDVEIKTKKNHLKEGFYCFAVRGLEVNQTQASQDRLRLTLAPCTKEGNAKSADETYAHTFDILAGSFNNAEVFTASKRAKLAATKGIVPDKIDQALVDAKVREDLNSAINGMYTSARAIFGRDELPSVPQFDEATKQFRDAAGNVVDRAAWESAKKLAVVRGTELISDVALGRRDIVGSYMVYGKVVKDTYNGAVFSRVKSIYDRLPDGAELVSQSDWAASYGLADDAGSGSAPF